MNDDLVILFDYLKSDVCCNARVDFTRMYFRCQASIMGANGTDDDIAVATEDGAHTLMGF